MHFVSLSTAVSADLHCNTATTLVEAPQSKSLPCPLAPNSKSDFLLQFQNCQEVRLLQIL